VRQRTAWAGRGAGTPALQLPLLRKNLVRANFAASKNKKENFQGAERHKLIDISLKSVKIKDNNGVYKVVIS
jgi:dynactin complex subunit